MENDYFGEFGQKEISGNPEVENPQAVTVLSVTHSYPSTSFEKKEERKGKKSKKTSVPASFVVLLLVLTVVVGAMSGAGGAFFMYKFMLPEDESMSETDSSAAPLGAVTETEKSEEENTFMPSSSASQEALPSENTTVEEISEGESETVLTKGQIYSSEVNSVVSIKSVRNQTYSSIFGSYSQAVTSQGTGFVITDDGYIVTNYHVIEGGESITVTDYNGNEYAATLAGGEEGNDVAVLKIDAKLTPVTLGESSSLEVGDDIFIIGNALGELSYTATDGIVSHLSREVKVESGSTINMFQTNTAINSGNSGGPVYNNKGEVVGIASAKYASDSVEGLGFCIPIDDVKQIISDIIVYGYVSGKPSLDVSLQTVTQTMAMRYSLPVGCYIVTLDSDGAAALGGLKSGDVITAIDSTKISSCDDLANALSSYSAKDTVSITYYRNSQSSTVTVTFSEKIPKNARTNYSNVYDY